MITKRNFVQKPFVFFVRLRAFVMKGLKMVHKSSIITAK